MNTQLSSVTIGIPTYLRPDLLVRALECVARQTYPNIKVVVSDNGTPGDEVEAVVGRFRTRIQQLEFHRQIENIGPRPNFFFLLDRADTDYFMWLADDDEISTNYVEKLVSLLDSDPGIVTAAGNWYLLRGLDQGRLMPPRDYGDSSPARRLARYLWQADDAFFYGLHRTTALKSASFSGYSWPNRADVMNWAYVYLTDMVLRGKVVIHPDTSVQFINHDYTAKTYQAKQFRLGGMLKVGLRRINVHALYLIKIAREKGALYAVPFASISAASLGREALKGLVKAARRLLRPR